MIDPGKLRHRIVLETPTRNPPDSYGQEKDAWSVEAELFAEVVELSGRELEHAQRKVNQATHSVRLRHRQGLSEQKRFSYHGRKLHIASVVANYAEDEMVCLCTETK